MVQPKFKTKQNKTRKINRDGEETGGNRTSTENKFQQAEISKKTLSFCELHEGGDTIQSRGSGRDLT